jgi:DNA repair protein RadC
MSDLSYRIKSSEELLAFVLDITVDDATKMLKEAGNVFNITKRMDIPERFGVTPQQIAKLSAAIVLSDKGRLASDLRKDMTQAEKIAANFADLRVLDHEELWVAFLDYSGKMLRRDLLSQGDDNHTAAPPHFIARNAIMCNADMVILVHNHPSGDCNPSEGDIAVTMMVDEHLKAINVRLLDHVIVGNGGYYSFTENKILSRVLKPQEPTDTNGLLPWDPV